MYQVARSVRSVTGALMEFVDSAVLVPIPPSSSARAQRSHEYGDSSSRSFKLFVRQVLHLLVALGELQEVLFIPCWLYNVIDG